MSFLEELKRRNVVKAATLYVVAAWLILQVADVLFDALDLPSTWARLILAILILGFPLTLIISWVYEMTPEGLKREKDVDRSQSITHLTGRRINVLIIVLLVLAIAAVAVDRLVPEVTTVADMPAVDESEAAVATGFPTEKSVAVLPFANRSARDEDRFFVDGIHDDILTQLARIDTLSVISRTSVERFRDTTQGMKEIGALLGVKHILEGGVQRAGDRVRINVQLIDVSTDEHLWAETYDRELSTANIFAIQSEISAAIAAALKVALSPEEAKQLNNKQTDSMAALESYFLGRQAMANRTGASLAQAERHFARAIELDTNYALAYVGLADTYYLQIIYSGRRADEQKALAEPLIRRAIAIDDSLGQAYVAMANVVDDPEAREDFFRKGIDLAPGYALGHHWYADFLSAIQGRRRDALIEAEKAERLDPLSNIVKSNKGEILTMLGRFDEARREYETIIRVDPGFVRALANLGHMEREVYGRLDNAIVQFRKAAALDPGNVDYLGMLALLWDDLGGAAEADHSLNRARAVATAVDDVNGYEAWLKVARGGVFNAVTNAEAILAEYPTSGFALWILALDDLRLDRAENAVARYRSAYPALMDEVDPVIDLFNFWQAIQIAYVLKAAGDHTLARLLLDRSLAFIQTIPRLGLGGYWYADAEIFAIQGKNGRALVALREAVDEGWRAEWQYALKYDPVLEALHGEIEYRGMVAELEADMAEQLKRVREMEANGDLAPIPE